jgi:hypothetical protein
MTADIETENSLRRCSGFFGRASQGNSTGLASAAGEHLRFDDYRCVGCGSELLDLVWSNGNFASIDGDTMVLKDFGRLVFV